MPTTLEDLLVSGAVVSGEKIAERTGVSRTAIFKQVNRLRASGYSIESIPRRGYRLVPRFDSLLPLEVRARLHAQRPDGGEAVFGRRVLTFRSVTSTQECVRKEAESGSPEGTLVIALEQSSGRGRSDRRWFAPVGGLWFSLLLRPGPAISMREIHKLTLLFGVSVAEAVSGLGVRPCLRWPNDVLVNERKICGILLETSAEPDRVNHVIVGIGLNANNPVRDLPGGVGEVAASLADLLGRRVDRAALLCRILKTSEELYLRAASEGFRGVLDSWRAMSCTIGRSVRVRSPEGEFTGRALDIDEDGFLILETGAEGGRRRICCGDLIHTS